ncbi:hypothetical protein [Frateuria sp. STR12]|uniref:hypothetical protein n=1 Tax=Frateuria hangzhouensis TaxID=2995589 RepID=UPI0022609351|nr:hypothetical protein [Frateuria sp. STR12]MCX7512775.1 hypothetical protein [Frateuria sp. STR12]
MAVVAARSRPGFGAWRVGTWIVLLLAAFGGVAYLRHGDWPYLAGAFAVIVACAGSILRQPWARQALRVVALLLVLWALATGGLMLAHWDQFDAARAHAAGQPQAEILLLAIEQARRSFLLGLVLKALLIPLLLWLAWQLGRPAVRAQFLTRR